MSLERSLIFNWISLLDKWVDPPHAYVTSLIRGPPRPCKLRPLGVMSPRQQ